MKRLGHSFKAFLRVAQTTRHEVLVFVEGDNVDPYFYDEITKRVCLEANKTYRLCRSYEIDGENGGKETLLSYFKYLRDKSSLIDSFKGKKTLSVFFLDKDIDDLLRRKISSAHIVYTKNYDAESHVFTDGDLIKAVATATSATIQEAANLLGGNQQQWKNDITNIWKEWIKLCVFAAKKNINHVTNYGVTSRINNPLFSPTDQALYVAQLASVKNKSNLTDAQFNRAYRRISNFVDRVYGRGEQDTIFKGKWYSTLVEEIIRSNVRHRKLNGVGDRVLSGSLQTLDFDLPWADHFKDPLRNLVRLL
jgi:hypothetical protein